VLLGPVLFRLKLSNRSAHLIEHEQQYHQHYQTTMAASLPQEMQALQLTKARPPFPLLKPVLIPRQYNTAYELNTQALPTIGPNDLLIRVHAAGYCHTEYSLAFLPSFQYPHTSSTSNRH
jgi:hypothetical protein